MKRNCYTVEIPDTDYWKSQIKCQSACPVQTNARGYVRAIAEGDFEKAYLIARSPNPLASVCGRICRAPCESDCRRADLDEPISIRALKRFVTEKFGAESGKYDDAPLEVIDGLLSAHEDECLGIEDLRILAGRLQTPAISDDSPSVAIIGAGPAGLAAAHDLCLMGIKPVIYEMEPVPAGMLYLGVPEYRLPHGLIEAEIEVIKALGTEIICNTQVGKDITLTELRSRYDAVLIAVGAKKSQSIPIPNVDAAGVIGGVDFLRDVALKQDLDLGGKVVVIGGGSVAMDCVRTALRAGSDDVNLIDVDLIYRRTEAEMPADPVEIEEAKEEGVSFRLLTQPIKILTENDKVIGLECLRMELGQPDESGRPRPVAVEGSNFVIKADKILLSVGQDTDLSFIDTDDVLITERGPLKLIESRAKTEAEDLFTAGDVAYGPHIVVEAIASGKKAARGIYSYLKKRGVSFASVVDHKEIKNYKQETGIENIPREDAPVSSLEDRKRSMALEVEEGYSEIQVISQASRCLDCAVNTIFDSEKCVLCGGCADVCPMGCLKLVSLESLEGDDDLDQLLKTRFDDMPLSEGGAIIKDETVCIRCGLCAERCPVGAITMESFTFKEEWVDEQRDSG